MNKPNIIMINSDHQATHQWEFYNNLVNRPYFDQFVAEGCQFTDAYCAAPLCGPSRRTLLTGLYPHGHRQYHNETNWPYDREIYLDSLAESGYRNFYYGKWHAGSGNALDHHCDGLSLNDYGNPYVTEAYHDYLKELGLPQAAHLVKHCFQWASEGEKAYHIGAELYEQVKKGELFHSQDPRHCCEAACGITVTPKETHESFFLANMACRQLEKLAKETYDGRGPFNLRVDFWGPHQPYFPTQEYYDMYRDMVFSQYPNYADTLENKPEVYYTEKNVPIGEHNRIVIPNALGWPAYEEWLRYCAAQITMIDAAVGMILNRVKKLGLDENTLIIWTADHGDGLACHGGHFDKGSYLSQEVIRVPLALQWKDVIPQGKKISDPVCTVNVPVTIMDAAGLRFSQNDVDGESLLPYCTSDGKNHSEYSVTETYGLGYGEYVTARAVVTRKWKLIATDEQKWELYNLEEDPYELCNLIDDKTYENEKKMLLEYLEKWQKRTKDPAILKEIGEG